MGADCAQFWGWVQGVRILLGENFQEIVSFQTGSFTFGRNTDLGAVPSA